MDNIKEIIAEEFKEREARRQYAAELLYSHIALQVKTLRQQRKWSQAKLGKLAGKHQSQISEMEQIDYSAWTLSALLKLAEAFDLALTVNFESFGGFLDDITSVSREALERPSFADDPAFKSRNRPVAAVSTRKATRSQLPGDNVVYLKDYDRNYPAESVAGQVKTKSLAQVSSLPMAWQDGAQYG